MKRREFEGNVLTTISDNEVRVWVCNKKGMNIFRFKAIGKVYESGTDITVMHIEDKNEEEENKEGNKEDKQS